jgi:hypothetical protein
MDDGPSFSTLFARTKIPNPILQSKYRTPANADEECGQECGVVSQDVEFGGHLVTASMLERHWSGAGVWGRELVAMQCNAMYRDPGLSWTVSKIERGGGGGGGGGHFIGPTFTPLC